MPDLLIGTSGYDYPDGRVNFNNHPNGSGTKNGLKLKEMVAEDFL